MTEEDPITSQGPCPECGAAVTPGGSCKDHFHAMLALEWEIPGGPGEMAHFYAVSTYVLQHPDSMRDTAEALLGLRDAVSSALSGSADIDQLRAWARGAAPGEKRITRRGDEPAHRWQHTRWTRTVTDALAGGTDGYADRVEDWARSAIADIETADRHGEGECV